MKIHRSFRLATLLALGCSLIALTPPAGAAGTGPRLLKATAGEFQGQTLSIDEQFKLTKSQVTQASRVTLCIAKHCKTVKIPAQPSAGAVATTLTPNVYFLHVHLPLGERVTVKTTYVLGSATYHYKATTKIVAIHGG
jgi:hypothetical protein